MSGNPPAGYYADPSIPGYIRYWDGDEWVAGTSRPAPEEAADQAPAGSSPSVVDAVADAVAQPAAEAWTPAPVIDAQPQAPQQYVSQQPAAPQQAVPNQYVSQQAVPNQYVSNPQQPQPQQYASNAPQQYTSQPAMPQQYASNAPQQAVPSQAVSNQAVSNPNVASSQQILPQQYPSNAPQQAAAQQYASNPQQPAVPQQAVPNQAVSNQYASNPQPPSPMRAPEPQPVQPAPATVAGMVVPSAFAARNATGTYAYGQANPFAGLPGASARSESEEEPPAKVLELATPGSRVLARIIDLGIAAVFSSPITVTLLLLAHKHDHQYVLGLEAKATTTYTTLGMDATGIALWVGAAIALILVAIVYEGYRLGRGGQTVGKKLAGVRVVRMPDANALRGGAAGMRRALLLWVLAILPVIDLLALGGVLWGRPYRQGLHERVTSTATVKA